MGVARLFRMATPFNAVELADMDYAQQGGDTMYLAHLDHPVSKVVRHDHDDWRYSEVSFAPTILAPTGLAVDVVNTNPPENRDENYWAIDHAYVVTSIGADGSESRPTAQVTASNDLTLTGNRNTLSWTAATGAEKYAVYKTENNSGYFGFVGYAKDTSFVDNGLVIDYADTPPVAANPFSGAGNNPSTLAFDAQRLLFGRTRNRPNLFAASRVGDFENLDVSETGRADDAIETAVIGGGPSEVDAIVSANRVLILTSEGIYRAEGEDGGPLTASPPPRIRAQIGRGASRLKPVQVDNTVFYVPNTGTEVYAISYRFEFDGESNSNVSIFAPHLFAGFTILWWAFARHPLSVLWCGRSDGTLLAFTWEQDQQVAGWTRCPLGGVAESGCVITEDGEDVLYMIVRRTVGGKVRRFKERMASAVASAPEDYCFLDAARSYYLDDPITVVPGLWHLEGEKVEALADGEWVKGLLVTDGKVTLPRPARTITVGLPFVALIKTLPDPRIAAGLRSSSGPTHVRVLQTRGIEIGPTEDKLFPVKERIDEPWAVPTSLQDGVLAEQLVEVDWSDGAALVVLSAGPFPMTVLGFKSNVKVNDRGN